MATINYAAREINVKIVYYGPALSGKTTNLQIIHKKTPQEAKSDMVSLATEADRTLFFDFLPIDLGKIRGFTTKIQLYTVPGQVYYNATRKLVLRGVDGIVFVADSDPDKMDENIESLTNMEDNLAEYGYSLDAIPVVLQYNKRDLPNALSLEQLNSQLNRYNAKWSEAIARSGPGVFETLKLIGKEVIDILNQKYASPMGAQTQQVPTQAMPAQPQRPPVQQTPPPVQPVAPQPQAVPQQMQQSQATPPQGQPQFPQGQAYAQTQQIPVQPVQPTTPIQQAPPVQQAFAQQPPVQQQVPVQPEQVFAQPQQPVQPAAPTIDLNDAFVDTPPQQGAPVQPATPQTPDFSGGAIELDDFGATAPTQQPVQPVQQASVVESDPFLSSTPTPQPSTAAPATPPIQPLNNTLDSNPFLETAPQQPAAPLQQPTISEQAPTTDTSPFIEESNQVEVEDVLDLNAITPVAKPALESTDQLFFTTNEGNSKPTSKKKPVNPKYKKNFMNSFNDLFNKPL